MPRPKDLTPEQLKEYEKSFLDFKANNVYGLPDVILDIIKEQYIAGCWLGQQLENHGCADALVENICMASGQKMVFGDPWGIAVQTLADYDQGKHETPGPELAEQLIKENL